ncbi:Hypothetical protein PHPALM_9064 [Phytophthora palmivora]|uniref:NADP-dependent oxidoreductase domain-containing protein n=1 Tax=Phytophthora palmivora TaxID=4796 RepID=A0A2P4Y891_9STRA|nr:Hypothetical protein PHPALM_9064 [Phytophthora palmivora]
MGKYSAGTPDGSRLSSNYWKAFTPDSADREYPSRILPLSKADKLKPLVEDLGVSMAVFAIAWCLSNHNVSTVLIGATITKQLEQNMEALKVVDKITPEVKAEVEALVQR